MRYKLFGYKANAGNILVYEDDNLEEVKRHYEDIEQDTDYVSANIIDSVNWSVISYIDFNVVPRNDTKVKKIGVKRDIIGR